MGQHRLFEAAAALLIAASPIPTSAAGQLVGATEFTQILNNAELVGLVGQSGVQIDNQITQIGHQLEQIQNQLRIYENMMQNTLTLPDQVWGQVESDLDRLRTIVGEGQGMAFSMGNIDDMLKQRFQSYSEFLADPLRGEDFSAAYQSWSDTNRDTIAGTLKTANLTAEQFSSEEATMAQLRNMSQTSVGQMQALQVGHQIATQQVAQTQKLRGLVSQQMTMMGTWYQSEQAARDLAQSRREEFFNATRPPTSGGQQMEPRW
ncbi:P-type conjugative transfer protein TrbJ (plasmid) [Devosia neptuniae]|uniref:P-type conjugative transfer protein TrbJ n=1 Tax=Devosia neptuniae TaxID=191302 RepID=A0ABY6C6L9_9HYPH|nr:P-type conjugative transfer protein TrbJ [Devosia neptuniae]UXN67920.1 P-type conjugative transfer protein TrbJ [Devosia neptuniae]